MSLLANSNAIESGGYNIDRSLRFRSSASAYLNRTPASASNRKTWTWSGWVKRGSLGTDSVLFYGGFSGSANNTIRFNADNTFYVFRYDGAITWGLSTTQVFRDPSAWYHICIAVDTTQATSADRVKVYVNGSQVTSFTSASYPSLNLDGDINNTVFHAVGNNAATNNFDGYLAEVNFIDGQALTPSSFGETSTETGVWVPKKYTGTYGTNGFYLDFKDNTSATTLAYDKSGNGNNWTPNNISTTAGSTYDSMLDVPTLTSATAANYAVLNPLSTAGGTFADGNLTWTSPATDQRFSLSTFDATTSGKWYCEMTIGSKTGTYWSVGVFGNPQSATPRVMYRSDGGRWVDGTQQSGNYASYTTGDVIGISYDSSTGSVSFYKNNALQGSMTVTSTSVQQYFACGSDSSGGTMTYYANFGQRPFSYTPPTGFKALNTFNLPDPTIKKPNQYMDVSIWSGNSSTQTITNGGFQPDLIWGKSRSYAYDNALYDSSRGITNKVLVSNSTNAEATYSSFAGVSSTGFTLDTNALLNETGKTYVGWQWKESATAGFDIVTYTGTGATANISHNLGVAPKMIVVKSRSIVSPNYGWQVQHTSLGATKSIVLNSTSAALTSTGFWNDTAPTSSVFTVGNDWDVNKSAATYVAYLFAEIAGFSKFGSYTGNGSTDGPFVYCGFRPKYVMIKKTSAGTASHWRVTDSSRDTYNVATGILIPSSSVAEVSEYDVDLLSNGFKLRANTTYQNGSGEEYIFAAFAENPFKYSNAR